MVDTFPSYVSIGRYSLDLYKMFQPDSKIVQFVFNKRNRDNTYGSHAYGLDVPYPLTAVNYIFPKLIFRKKIKEIESSNYIIHITSHSFPAIIETEKTVVTIHDVISFKGWIERESEPILKKLFKKYVRRNTRKYSKYRNIITVSNYAKKEIENEFSLDNDSVTVIYPPISEHFHPIDDKVGLRKELNLPIDKKLVLSVSST
ncbi:MAG: glycosyltransferase [Candidatus Micrarchaeaceae archaeon]